ncbi:response regulator, partial [Escherichia coli]|nr:response regulator [Escherichia coli]EKY6658332.1 response regulator [Escherichia coli]
MVSKYKVMLLDEQPKSMFRIHAMLDSTGLFDAHIASTKNKALALLDSNYFHVVILDVSMPEMDVLQLISKISKLKMNTMLVLVSSFSQNMMKNVSSVAQALGLAVIGNFKKPF